MPKTIEDHLANYYETYGHPTTFEKFAATRNELRRVDGKEQIKQLLVNGRFVDGATLQLKKHSGTVKNIFTLAGKGLADKFPIQNAELKNLGLMVLGNLEENDNNWAVEDKKNSASMSKNHKFLVKRGDLRWDHFNVLTMGMNKCQTDNDNDLHRLYVMREQGIKFAKSTKGWSPDLGMYFHVCPDNSVYSLHLHLVDLRCTGPAFNYQMHKNLSIDVAISVLEMEQRASSPWRVVGTRSTTSMFVRHH